ncbi:MAG: hypothetical protein ACFFDJ_03075 [Candidatus Odinarchaeota archaeon]
MSVELDKLSKGCQLNLAQHYDNKIESFMKPMGKEIEKDAVAKRKYENRLTWIMLLTKTLPLLTSIISVVLIFLTQQILTALINLINAIPPFLQDEIQKKIDFHNKRFQLCSALEDTRVDIKSFAHHGGLKGDILKVSHNSLDSLKSKINTTYDLNFKLKTLPMLVKAICPEIRG